jgi:ribosomal-protein-alanine N-acetyltransferase
MFMNLKVDPISYIPMTDHKKHEQQISLKAFTSADIDDFMEWATDDEVTKYMMWNSYTSRSEAEIFFSNVVEKHPWFKAVCLGKKIIGSITLDKGNVAHSCKAELGYVIARQYWGRGLATQSIKLAIETGFNDLDIERIEAYVDPVNIGSQRVLEKNGFMKECLLRKYVTQKGIVKDRILYSFLKPAC